MHQPILRLSLFIAIVFFQFACTLQEKESKKQRTSEQVDRPNIVFMMADDHAIRALSCYNGDLMQTPNIDRIAQNGIKFTRAYVTNSICGPSRAVILTGKHSHLNGFMRNGDKFDGDQVTLPKLLQQAGYQTAILGKWHLKSAPQGFDYYNVFPGQGTYYNPKMIKNGDTVQHEGYATQLVTDFTLDWLKTQRDTNKPFFLMYHHKAPHRNWKPEPKYMEAYDDHEFPLPATFNDDYEGRLAAAQQDMSILKTMQMTYDLKLYPPKEDELNMEWGVKAWQHFYEDRITDEQRAALDSAYLEDNREFRAKDYPDSNALAAAKYQRYMKDYCATIRSVDEQVGRVLDYLEEEGLDKNTLIVYTSDQGFYTGEHGWFDKRFMYEPSFGTPLLMQYKGQLPEGQSLDHLVMNLDFAPTFLDFAGVEVPSNMQGHSFRSIVEDPNSSWRDAIYYHYYEYPGFHMVKKHFGVRTDRYKLIRFYDDIQTWELYDLEKDPNELNNLYGKPAYDSIQGVLKQKLDSLQEFYKVPASDRGPVTP